jgi:hypothetical protein
MVEVLSKVGKGFYFLQELGSLSLAFSYLLMDFLCSRKLVSRLLGLGDKDFWPRGCRETKSHPNTKRISLIGGKVEYT